MTRKLFSVLVILGLAVAMVGAPASARSNDSSDLQWFGPPMVPEEGPVGHGAHTTLGRTVDAISVHVHARHLEPGHVHTVWVVIFNTPDGCATSPCGEPDLENLDATPAVIWSGIGGPANGGGQLNGHSYLAEGNPQGYQALFGDLLDAEGAEIHFVVRSHGPATGDPAQASTFEAGCTPESSFGLGDGEFDCFDPQFSIHQP